MRVGRNETCPCGSGKKFKHCCAHKNTRAASKGLILLGVAIAAIAAVGLLPLLPERAKKAEPIPAVQAPPPPRPGPQPPGPVPPGKVWSTEHGHWHDVAARSPIQITPGPGLPANAAVNAQTPGSLTPAPPGPAPEGKVWSPEHGHWHDVTPAATTTT
jgi:hypothetical protein